MKSLHLKTIATGLSAALLLISGMFANQVLAAGGGGAPPARVVVAKSGGNYTTITAAMTAINPTATAPVVIEVWPGTYTEPATVDVKSYVHIKGSGREVTTVKISGEYYAGAPYSPSAFVVDGKTNVAISGLTISGAYLGIYFRNSVGTISENTASNGSSGIVMNNSTSTTLPPYSVIISGNNVYNNRNNGIEVTRGNAVVTNNSVSGNGDGTWSGGGIWVYYAANSVISGNVITANNGTGIHLFNDSTPTISNNVITDNILAGLEYNYITSGGSATNNKIVNNGGTIHTDIVVADADNGTTVQPNISFNVFDDINGGVRYPSSSGTRGVGSYNVNSNGDPIAVP